MMTKRIRISLLFTLFFLLLFAIQPIQANAQDRGIYLTQSTLENTQYLNAIIKRAKAARINTFIVDLDRPTKRYRDNMGLVKDNNIKWIARIVMFPEGGTAAQIRNPSVWQKKYTLVKQAVDWGANEIQLDYIRYKASQKPSAQNAKDIETIIQWYKNKLAAQNIPLQIDVFGIASFGESKYIGQNIALFSDNIDALCPMVYPSHFTPFAEHYKKPYDTIYSALQRIDNMFDEKRPFKMYAWIELSNYHYPMNKSQRLPYIKAQIKAVNDAKADGWYAWSPHNRYDYLFDLLEKEG